MTRVARSLWRSDLARQFVIVVGLAELYEAGRHFIRPNWPEAFANADRIVELERALHLAWEQSLQRFFLEIPDVVEAMNIFYFVGHFLLTGVFFFWLFFRSRDGYGSFRNGFLIATIISLVIHWKFPTAPPRLADVGLDDTLRTLSNIEIGSPTNATYANPVAAVPSLHAGWALCVGIGLIKYGRHPLFYALGVLYPLAVMLTIIVTGNHFVLDAVAGMAVMGLGFLLSSVFWPRRPKATPDAAIIAA